MNNIQRLTIALVALTGSLSPLIAANPAASATIDVELVAPLSMAKSADMQFGRVSMGGAGTGILVLGVDGSVQTTNIYASQSSSGATPAAAVFSVSGLDGANYTVLLPSSPVALTKVGSTETLNVSDFTVKLASKVAGTLIGAIGSDNSFAVGATLTIPQTQTEGRYQGTFPVSISYN